MKPMQKCLTMLNRKPLCREAPKPCEACGKERQLLGTPCPYCRKIRYSTDMLCQECTHSHTDAEIKHYKKQLIAAGLCCECGAEPLKGKRLGANCLQKRRELQNLAREEQKILQMVTDWCNGLG